ncbi:hypothetical protein [Tsukamurella soli]|uniref:BON domain-containing protein n=1 Tax=Tsukamurella soli TaxID=644556 RepID=A0ABP8JUA9_9ACTN
MTRLGRTWARVARWWRGGPTRLRLRRRLLVVSTPFAVLAVSVAVVLVTVTVASRSAVGDFERHDVEALRGDIAAMHRFGVVDTATVSVASGDLAVLEGRIDDADGAFTAALRRSDTCATRVDLEVVEETQGDVASVRGDRARAEERYIHAVGIVEAAAPGCFQGNTDPDQARRRIRSEALPRLRSKIASLHQTAASSTSPVPASPTSAPPASATLTPTPLPARRSAGPAPSPSTAPLPPSQVPVVGTGTGTDANSTPIVGPGGGAGGDGSGVLDPVDPDRIPVAGGRPGPGHRLGVGSDPTATLQRVLGNSDATGASQE